MGTDAGPAAVAGTPWYKTSPTRCGGSPPEVSQMLPQQPELLLLFPCVPLREHDVVFQVNLQGCNDFVQFFVPVLRFETLGIPMLISLKRLRRGRSHSQSS